jgi:hypothetical protein
MCRCRPFDWADFNATHAFAKSDNLPKPGERQLCTFVEVVDEERASDDKSDSVLIRN